MKNCPFCKSFDVKITGELMRDGTHEVYVKCVCGSRGPTVKGEGKHYTSEESALAFTRWNNQENSEPLPKHVFAIAHPSWIEVEGETQKTHMIPPHLYPIYTRERDAQNEKLLTNQMLIVKLELK